MEDREAAKSAARKAGVPIGVWLSEQIRHAAEDPASVGQSDKKHPVHRQADATLYDGHHHDGHQQGQARRQSTHAPQEHHFGDHAPQGRRLSGSVDPRFAFGRGQWSIADKVAGNGVGANAPAGSARQFRALQNPPQNSAQAISSAPLVGQPASQIAGHHAGISAEKVEALAKRFESFEERLHELHHRINSVEDKTLERFKPIITKIESLTIEINQIVSSPAMGAEGKASFSTTALERAVMRLSERVGRVEQNRSARVEARPWIFCPSFPSGVALPVVTV